MNNQVFFRQKVLLVDDEEDILLELSDMLESEGFRCYTAQSVSQALEHLDKHPEIGLVITDLRMPEESGLRLIQKLRTQASRQNLPVIVTSGHAEMNDVIEVLRLQVLDFYPKPIYYERLLDTLDKLFPYPVLALQG
ncbi:Transcriptional regulatory protein FixJ [compost metagenome]